MYYWAGTHAPFLSIIAAGLARSPISMREAARYIPESVLKELAVPIPEIYHNNGSLFVHQGRQYWRDIMVSASLSQNYYVNVKIELGSPALSLKPTVPNLRIVGRAVKCYTRFPIGKAGPERN